MSVSLFANIFAIHHAAVTSPSCAHQAALWTTVAQHKKKSCCWLKQASMASCWTVSFGLSCWPALTHQAWRRSAAFTNMGLAAEPDNSGAPLITMLKKKGKRILENADEVMAHLQAAFPWARFNTLDGDAVASMSIKEQVLLLGAHGSTF